MKSLFPNIHLARPFSLFLCVPLLGCAEAAFSVHTQDNDLVRLKPTVERMGKTQATAQPLSGTGHSMVFVALGPERTFGKAKAPGKEGAAVETTLVGYDLTEQKERFAVPSDVRSRFVVSQGVVMYREGESSLVLRDVASGSVRARVDLQPGETLAGLSSDDKQLYYVTWSKVGKASQSFLTALSPQGAQVWRLPAQGSMGVPATFGGMLAVPYRYQNVVVLDAQNGKELARIRQKDEQIGFARAGAHGFLYGVGASGAALLDEKSANGERKTVSFVTPKLDERVRVFLHWDGYRPEQSDFSAFDRNRLLWDAEEKDGAVRFAGDQTVLHSYRFLFGMDAQNGQVRWAYPHSRVTLMASEVAGDTLLYVAQDGEIGGLRKQTGAKVASQKLSLKPGQVVIGASFDAAGFQAPGQDLAKPQPVLEVLRGIVFDRDSSFLSVKNFAVQAMGALPEKDAAAELVKVITAEGLPTEISKTAGEVLAKRKDDRKELAALVVAALSQSYNHLEDKRPRGLDVLARAAKDLKLTETVPLLAERLHDPSTPQPALKDIVLALTSLGGKDAIPPLRKLLFLYRADPTLANDPELLRRTGEGLLALGGETERRLLEYVAREPLTVPALATHFRKVLDDRAKPPAKTQKKL